MKNGNLETLEADLKKSKDNPLEGTKGMHIRVESLTQVVDSGEIELKKSKFA